MGHGKAIAVLAFFAVTVLGIFLGTGDPTNSMELFNLVPVREAFRDHHWLVPTLGGWPRLEKPPLCVWIPGGLAALVGSDSLWVVRIPSVVMAFLTAVATYGIGCLILPGRGVALLAGVMLLGMFAFDRHARLASYDIYAAAFTAGAAYFLLLVAEGRATGWRAVMWTLLAGISLGLSLLAKGPAPAATVLLPLIVWLAIYHPPPSTMGRVAGGGGDDRGGAGGVCAVGDRGGGALPGGVGVLEGGVAQVVEGEGSQCASGDAGYDSAVVLLLAGVHLDGAVYSAVRGGALSAVFPAAGERMATRALAGMGGDGGRVCAAEFSGGEGTAVCGAAVAVHGAAVRDGAGGMRRLVEEEACGQVDDAARRRCVRALRVDSCGGGQRHQPWKRGESYECVSAGRGAGGEDRRAFTGGGAAGGGGSAVAGDGVLLRPYDSAVDRAERRGAVAETSARGDVCSGVVAGGPAANVAVGRPANADGAQDGNGVDVRG